jgi:hypothetical protein
MSVSGIACRRPTLVWHTVHLADDGPETDPSAVTFAFAW